MAAPNLQVEQLTDGVSAEIVTALETLADVAQKTDGAPPFSEQTLVELHQAARLTAEQEDAPSPVALVLAWITGEEEPELAGAGVVVLGSRESDPENPRGETEPDVLELVVHPEHRRRGVATALAESLSATLLSPDSGGVYRAWAHGGHEGGPALAQRFDWTPARELWRMRLENSVELPERLLPEGVRIRSFVPGEDNEAWLHANAAAFADHPEQGRLTEEDLQARIDADWFSAEGFLLAEDTETGELLGYHWTKIPPAEAGEERLGEVYVVGVTPAAQGRGLGAALTLAGLKHLREKGVDAIILYVDASNTPAAQLYKKLGFTVWDVDTQYEPLITSTAEPS
ncbi:mycothiol synthase [Nesterenkonia flava]|uniref:Mycothiol acetyltransferase n=1 Tax=Nesterenkonia flava TaxID=469799 RepID=A0ABU1FU13_9MICC|nr:mycothiol synthase [Nesterenkonia flava]MDR5712152.1 mycothiol synthase [Nesterenkonia flava]